MRKSQIWDTQRSVCCGTLAWTQRLLGCHDSIPAASNEPCFSGRSEPSGKFFEVKVPAGAKAGQAMLVPVPSWEGEGGEVDEVAVAGASASGPLVCLFVCLLLYIYIYISFMYLFG